MIGLFCWHILDRQRQPDRTIALLLAIWLSSTARCDYFRAMPVKSTAVSNAGMLGSRHLSSWVSQINLLFANT
jgi:hypothetical protein